MKVKISIIIPFYNTEKYIKRCLDSVVAQTFQNYEVILVDDGSTDHSYEIAKKFEMRFPNFRLIRQANTGVAIARNIGISKASGEYIAFIDSDDFVDRKYLDCLYQTAVKTMADIVCCNFYWFYPNRIAMKNYTNFKKGEFSNIEALGMIIADTQMQSYVWNKLWKRELFKLTDVRFQQLYFEDISTSFKLVYYSNKVVIIKKALYYYTQRKGSILHEFSFETQNCYLKSIMIIKNFLDTHGLYEMMKKPFTFLCLKAKIVMVSSLFLIHLHEKDFRMLIYNYKKAFWFIENCKRYISNSKLNRLNKLKLFR